MATTPNTERPDDQPTNDSSDSRSETPKRSRDVIDRRLGLDRRDAAPAATGFERRRGPGRRRSDFMKSAEEGELTTEQYLFLMAIQEFKQANSVSYPAWTDVLEVIRLLGYRKTQPSAFKLRNADDWRESSNAAANVRPDRWAERFDDDELRELGEGAA